MPESTAKQSKEREAVEAVAMALAAGAGKGCMWKAWLDDAQNVVTIVNKVMDEAPATPEVNP